ncbi:MAG: hypothetical protein JWN79_3200, partial [Gemmatimonadetes bacterium]|nr:hypothetical protein [Gemmatimonadota bacterium]
PGVAAEFVKGQPVLGTATSTE